MCPIHILFLVEIDQAPHSFSPTLSNTLVSPFSELSLVVLALDLVD